MNYTWKRLHHLVFNLMKNVLKNDSMISARFFLSYAAFQKYLPFYERIHFEDAHALAWGPARFYFCYPLFAHAQNLSN